MHDDQLYLSKFELDPEDNIFMDSIDDAAYFGGGDDDNMDNYLDVLENDIWEA